MSSFEFKILEGQGPFENAVDFNTAKASVELVTGQTVVAAGVLDKGNGPFVLWKLADKSATVTPAGPSVSAGDNPKGLTFGWNEGMDTFVAYQPGEGAELFSV